MDERRMLLGGVELAPQDSVDPYSTSNVVPLTARGLDAAATQVRRQTEGPRVERERSSGTEHGPSLTGIPRRTGEISTGLVAHLGRGSGLTRPCMSFPLSHGLRAPWTSGIDVDGVPDAGMPRTLVSARHT